MAGNAGGGGAVGATFMLLRPLLQRYVVDRDEIPPEQINQLTRRRYICEKLTSLIIVLCCCLTLLVVGIIKIEQVQNMLFNSGSDSDSNSNNTDTSNDDDDNNNGNGNRKSILEMIFCNVKSIANQLLLEQRNHNNTNIIL